MSEFKVNQEVCSDISRKYASAISRTGLTMLMPLRVNTNLSISGQSSKDVSIIKQNLNICTREINQLYLDLIGLRNGIEAIRTESEEADRNVKIMFILQPFSFGSLLKKIIDRLKTMLGGNGDTMVTATNNIVSKLKEWSEQIEENRIEQEEILVVPLNGSNYESDEPQEIPIVDPENVQPSDGYVEVVEDGHSLELEFPQWNIDEKTACTVEDNKIKITIPGKNPIILDEFPLDSKYPNSYTVTINGESVYLAGAQCLGFARYVHEKMYGDHHISGENDSFTRSMYNISSGSLTLEQFKELASKSGVGAHIRTNPRPGGEWGHSMIIAGISDDGITIIDANGDGYGTVAMNTYTWEEYMSRWGGRGIEYIETYNG